LTYTLPGYNGVVAQATFSVPAMHCQHCEAAVAREGARVRGVTALEVDLERKLVTVRGDGLDDAALARAIDAAGYDAERVPEP
jgi:copper chaperone